jgi:carbon-monoxide dehydrogenase small subunit
VMSAADLIQRNPDPTEDDVRHWLEGNLCRCTGYHNIVKAVMTAAETMRAGAGQGPGAFRTTGQPQGGAQ